MSNVFSILIAVVAVAIVAIVCIFWNRHNRKVMYRRAWQVFKSHPDYMVDTWNKIHKEETTK